VPLLVGLADLGDGLELVGAKGGGGHRSAITCSDSAALVMPT
jgi:hypothetical protein